MPVEAQVSKLNELFRSVGVSFALETPSGTVFDVGDGEPTVRVLARTKRALNHLLCLRENGIVESYLRGELDMEGSLRDALECRAVLTKNRGLAWLLRFAIPFFTRQAFTNRIAIRKHYDLDPDFYLAFLDPQWPAYSQGIYTDGAELLSTAIERKFAFATQSCRIDRHSSVIEVGPGWGAYINYLLPTGARITAITNSARQSAFLKTRFSGPQLAIIENDLFSYHPRQKFSALTMMGVLEHLPNYTQICKKIRSLLTPGGYAYIDASAAKEKYTMSHFIYKHVFPYNHSFVHLDQFLDAARQHGFELVSLHDDSDNYRRTIVCWASNLDAQADRLEEHYGQYNVRRFRLYLWGSVNAFEKGDLQCHRLVLRAPS